LSRLIEQIWAEVPAHGVIVVDCEGAQIGEEEGIRRELLPTVRHNEPSVQTLHCRSRPASPSVKTISAHDIDRPASCHTSSERNPPPPLLRRLLKYNRRALSGSIASYPSNATATTSDMASDTAFPVRCTGQAKQTDRLAGARDSLRSVESHAVSSCDNYCARTDCIPCNNPTTPQTKHTAVITRGQASIQEAMKKLDYFDF
jgi:hypothetical protein